MNSDDHADGTAPTLTPEQQRVLHGIDAVLTAMPTTLPAAAVRGFLMAPNPDLSIGERDTSPLEWLLGGGDAATVVELAVDLDLLP